MIGWLDVLSHAFWIVGLATLLATLSLVHWLAGMQDKSLRQGLSEPPSHLAIAIGILLFALGLMLIAAPWWHKIPWVGITVLSLWQGVVAWRDRRSGQTRPS